MGGTGDGAGSASSATTARGGPGVPGAVTKRLRRVAKRAMRSRLGHALGERSGRRRRSFERAYRTGAWTSTGESASGDGSSLAATEQVRAALPGVVEELGVRVLVDLPCGDWNWMSVLDLPIDRYIGGDLVAEVVERNRIRFGDDRHEFEVVDLCTDPLPAADLLLCRDALIHFSERDIWRALHNIVDAEITYLATTTFPATTTNEDIPTGIGWRHLNLQIAPFHLPAPLMTLADSYNRPDQVLSIWRVGDVRAALDVRSRPPG